MTESERLEEWYVVFDDTDLHPLTGQAAGPGHIVLNVTDRETARREACRRFGDQWAALLPKAETDANGGPGCDPLDERLWAGAHAEAHLLELVHGDQARYNGRR